MKSLLTLLLLCSLLPLQAADNNPRVIKLSGFRNLYIAPSPAWSPSNLLTLYGWWKADSLTNLVNGSTVSNWVDSSGHNLTMAGTIGAPYFTNGFINGQPAVFFNGSTDAMTNAAAMNQTNVIVFVIRHMIPTTADMYLFETASTDDIGGFGAAQYFRWQSSIYTNAVAYAGAGMTATNSLTNTVTTYIVQFADDLSRIWTNGVPAHDVQGSGKLVMNGMKVGSSAALDKFFKGHIMEMFCLTNQYVTQGTTLSDISNYLRAKYAHY